MPWRAHQSRPAPQDGAVGGALRGGRHRIRLAAGRQAEPHAAFAGERQHRVERLALAQFAFRQPVGTHDDLVAWAEFLAMQDTGHLKRPGVGPHCVMVGRRHAERTVGQDGIEMVTGDALAAENRVIHALPDQHGRVRPRGGVGADRIAQRLEARNAGKLQVREFRSTRKEMHMCFDEARQHGAASGIDGPGPAPLAPRRSRRNCQRRRSTRP